MQLINRNDGVSGDILDLELSGPKNLGKAINIIHF